MRDTVRRRRRPGPGARALLERRARPAAAVAPSLVSPRRPPAARWPGRAVASGPGRRRPAWTAPFARDPPVGLAGREPTGPGRGRGPSEDVRSSSPSRRADQPALHPRLGLERVGRRPRRSRHRRSPGNAGPGHGRRASFASPGGIPTARSSSGRARRRQPVLVRATSTRPARSGRRPGAAGQAVGRIGLTGRTTGPHLHLEICGRRAARRPRADPPQRAACPGASARGRLRAPPSAASRPSRRPSPTPPRSAPRPCEAGIDPLLLAALVRTESGFRPRPCPGPGRWASPSSCRRRPGASASPIPSIRRRTWTVGPAISPATSGSSAGSTSPWPPTRRGRRRSGEPAGVPDSPGYPDLRRPGSRDLGRLPHGSGGRA
ncbi:MAG: hypothetical protein KatS3mg065_0789 [Chloroflexota bacterium]|nr:MAG: hypothetical protein KatS3mg065_0789 [Chloroflexota bacterium]